MVRSIMVRHISRYKFHLGSKSLEQCVIKAQEKMSVCFPFRETSLFELSAGSFELSHLKAAHVSNRLCSLTRWETNSVSMLRVKTGLQ